MEKAYDISFSEAFRNEVRRQTIAERLAHRQLTLNHRRKNFDKIEQQLKSECSSSTEEVASLASRIKQNTNVSYEDLKALKQSLFDHDRIVTFLRVTGALQKIVGQLSGRKALQQLEAAYIICNLAQGDEHACVTVSRAAGPYLIQHLDGSSQSLQEACAWALGNLAGGSRKSYAILKSQGLVNRLTAMLQSPYDFVVDAVIYALCHTLQTASVCDQDEGLSSDEQRSLASAVVLVNQPTSHWLLYLLSSAECCDTVLLDGQIPSKCVKYLSENIPAESADIKQLQSATALVRTTANLCSEPTGRGAGMILRAPELAMVVSSFLQSSFAYLRTETTWMVANLLNHGIDSVRLEARRLFAHFLSETAVCQLVESNNKPVEK